MRFKIVLSWIVLLLFTTYCKAQSPNSVVVYGISKGTPNANIKIYNSIYGTSADEEGNYSIRVSSLTGSVKLQFSSIGYRDTLIDLDLTKSVNDSIRLDIQLSAIDYELEQVEISSDKEFLKLKTSKIIDFNFFNDAILVLASSTGKRVIYSVSTNGGINQKLELSETYEKIYIDCFESLFLISSNYALQITVDEDDLSIYSIRRFTINDFNKLILPCKADVGEYIVTSTFSANELKLQVDRYHNKRADFLYFDKKKGTDSLRYLTTVFDEEAFKISNSYYQDILTQYYKTTAREDNLLELKVWDGNIWELYNGDMELLKLISWYLQVESKSAAFYNYVINQDFFIVDLPNQKVLRFNDSLMQVGNLPIDNSLNGEEIEELLFDAKTKNSYTLSSKENYYSFRQFDLQNAKVLDLEYRVKIMFPIKIGIYNSFLYFASFDTFTKNSIIERKKIE